jgi:hypothetical protein
MRYSIDVDKWYSSQNQIIPYEWMWSCGQENFAQSWKLEQIIW